jgi:hypothetical protein
MLLTLNSIFMTPKTKKKSLDTHQKKDRALENYLKEDSLIHSEVYIQKKSNILFGQCDKIWDQLTKAGVLITS